MKMTRNPSLIFSAIVIAIGTLAERANAAAIIYVGENGNNVVAIGNGTLNTDSLRLFSTSSLAGTNPTFSNLIIGSGTSNYYTGSTGPANMSDNGTYRFIGADAASGDQFGVHSRGTGIAAPIGYSSGSFLSGNATWYDESLASLGLIEGSYLWEWGEGASYDSFTVVIGVVPEPSLGCLLIVSSAFFWCRRVR